MSIKAELRCEAQWEWGQAWVIFFMSQSDFHAQPRLLTITDLFAYSYANIT